MVDGAIQLKSRSQSLVQLQNFCMSNKLWYKCLPVQFTNTKNKSFLGEFVRNYFIFYVFQIKENWFQLPWKLLVKGSQIIDFWLLYHLRYVLHKDFDRKTISNKNFKTGTLDGSYGSFCKRIYIDHIRYLSS